MAPSGWTENPAVRKRVNEQLEKPEKKAKIDQAIKNSKERKTRQQKENVDKNDIPQEFYDLVDQFINLANDLEKEWPLSRVSATLMFAAARYNVFNWLNRDVDLEQNLGAAVAYYREQYGKMFQDNVEELTPVYAKPDIPGQDAT